MSLGRRPAVALASPLGILLLVTIAIPGTILLVYSFFDFDASLRRVVPGFDFDNYRVVLTESTFHTLAWNTLAITVPATVISVVAGYTLAYYLAFQARRSRTPVLALVVTSMLASYLVRIYAWRTLMGERGVVNSALEALGVIDEPLGFLLFSPFAVVIAYINLYLPFTTLLIYASLAGVPRELSESARDLGAGRIETLRRITLPLSGYGVLVATAFTFFLGAGDFITPALLGGTKSVTFGMVISSQLRNAGNYPLGATLSFVMLAAFAVTYLIMRTSLRASRLLPDHVV